MTDLFSYPHQPGAKARDTSFAAAEAIAPRAALLRARVLAVIEQSLGLTADECAGRMGMSILSIRPRLTELAQRGEVRDSGERRKNASGRNAIVWAPVHPAYLKGQRK